MTKAFEKEILKQDLDMANSIIKKVFGDREIENMLRMGGLTNHTYRIDFVDGYKIALRLPGEGTEDMLDRSEEKISQKLACDLLIDTELLYFGDDGTKITKFIDNAETMSAETLRADDKIKMVADIFKVLHRCGENTGVLFDCFEIAKNYKNIIDNHGVEMYPDYDEIFENVMKIKEFVGSDNAVRVPCHNDPICENWIYNGEKMFLIDWEYAGMNDAMWDIADVSIEASYSREQDMALLRYYFDREPTIKEIQSFYANKIYTDYLWVLWGKTRVPFDGKSMEEYADGRYVRLKRLLAEFNSEFFGE